MESVYVLSAWLIKNNDYKTYNDIIKPMLMNILKEHEEKQNSLVDKISKYILDIIEEELKCRGIIGYNLP